jgi:hypothetical protein
VDSCPELKRSSVPEEDEEEEEEEKGLFLELFVSTGCGGGT